MQRRRGKGQIEIQRTVIRIEGDGIAAVFYLIKTGQLKFRVVMTRHHGPNLWRAAVKKAAAHAAFRDALVYAAALDCLVRFRHGHTIDFAGKKTILIGIDCDPDEAVKFIAGPEFSRNSMRGCRTLRLFS